MKSGSCVAVVWEFLKWECSYTSDFSSKHSIGLVLLVTVFTSFYKIRVEGAGSYWEILCCRAFVFGLKRTRMVPLCCLRNDIVRDWIIKEWLRNIWNDYSPVGRVPLISPTWWEFQSANFSKMSLCLSLDGNQDSTPRLPYCFFWLFYLCVNIPSLLWLACVWTCSLELREDPGGWRKPTSCSQEMEGHRKTFVPRSPQGPAGIIEWVIHQGEAILSDPCFFGSL